MADIPDFTGESFDDIKELRKELTRALRELDEDANAPAVVNLGKNVVIAWYNDKETPLPDGYKTADGKDGTFDMRKHFTHEYFYIQKVR